MIDGLDIKMQEFGLVNMDGVVISMCPELVEKGQYSDVWGYYLCVENNTSEKIKLVGKNWNITDEKGNRYVDETEGFKGEIPELEPGEFFEFSSTAPLSSAAVFYGSCKIAFGKAIREIKIPTFSFDNNRNLAVN